MSNPDLCNLGRFTVAAVLARERDPEIYKVLEGLVVIHAEHMPHDDRIHYTARGSAFEDIATKQEPPYYTYSIVDDTVLWAKA